MKLIVGLGNPGKEYEGTRHNVGFMVLNYYLGNIMWREKDNFCFFKLDDVVFIKPTTFMNLSGFAVKKAMNYYKIDISDVLIIFDDLDLPLGNFKIKTASGAGGHNGVKSIISQLGTNEFNRLKIGISNDKKMDTKDYVLAKFGKQEMEVLDSLLPKFKNVINLFIAGGVENVLNKYKIGEDE